MYLTVLAIKVELYNTFINIKVNKQTPETRKMSKVVI